MGQSGGHMKPDSAPEQTQFNGSYLHSMDDKGRVVIPAAFREAVKEGMMMTLGQGCVALHPADSWDDLLNEIAHNERQDRLLGSAQRRIVLAHQAKADMDRQGRIAISATLRKRVQLGAEVLIQGVGPTIEIWSPELWDAYMEDYTIDLPGMPLVAATKPQGDHG